jgi:hypothetical protein
VDSLFAVQEAFEEGEPMKLLALFGGAMAQTGALGGYGDLFNEYNNSIVDLAPITKDIANVTTWAMNVKELSAGDIPNVITRDVGLYAMSRVGNVNAFIGGATSRMMKEAAKKNNVRFRDKSTGDYLDLDDSFTNFDTNFDLDFTY